MPKIVFEAIAHNQMVPHLIGLRIQVQIIQGEPVYTVRGSSFQGRLVLNKAEISAAMLRAAADLIERIDKTYRRYPK